MYNRANVYKNADTGVDTGMFLEIATGILPYFSADIDTSSHTDMVFDLELDLDVGTDSLLDFTKRC